MERTLVIAGVALALLAACYTNTPEHDTSDDSSDGRVAHTQASTGGCGDGEVSKDEECDPAAAGWQGACDDSCRRTVYEACSAAEECPGLNANCAAYTTMPEQLFCVDYCEADDTCTVLPGFRAICNFAWCVVLCNDGACPNRMACVRDQSILDHVGASKGTGDVCVIAPG